MYTDPSELEFGRQIAMARSYDEYVNLAVTLQGYRSEVDWLFGALAHSILNIRKSDPDADRKTTTLKHFAGEINESYSRIKDAARVVSLVSPEIRESYPMLTYGHWREIVKRKSPTPEVLQHWANFASDEGWSVSTLRGKLVGTDKSAISPLAEVRKLINTVKRLPEIDPGEFHGQRPEEWSELKAALLAFREWYRQGDARTRKAGSLLRDGQGLAEEDERDDRASTEGT